MPGEERRPTVSGREAPAADAAVAVAALHAELAGVVEPELFRAQAVVGVQRVFASEAVAWLEPRLEGGAWRVLAAAGEVPLGLSADSTGWSGFPLQGLATPGWLMVCPHTPLSEAESRCLDHLATALGTQAERLAAGPRLSAGAAFQSVLSQLPVPALLTRGGRVTAANPALTALVGRQAARVDDLAVSELVSAPAGTGLRLGGSYLVWPAPGGAPLRVRAVVGTCPAAPESELVLLLPDNDPNLGGQGLTVQLAAGLGHRFNNLLQTMVGHASLARLTGEHPDRREAHLAAIEDTVDEMARLTRELVAFAQIGPLQREALVADEVVAGALRVWPGGVQAPPVTANLGAAGVMLQADRRQLELVVRNLVANAREATGEGRRVAVSTEVVEVGDGEPADAGFPPRRGRYLRLRVEDQGSGIAPEQAEEVFRPFVSSRESGRGMGLAAVAGVCLRHGGGVLLASSPGQGTVVDAFFPLAETS